MLLRIDYGDGDTIGGTTTTMEILLDGDTEIKLFQLIEFTSSLTFNY